MKKLFKICSLLFVISLLTPKLVFASTITNTDLLNYNETNISREKKIMNLIDERQKVLNYNPVNIEQLNKIDIKLKDLGVEFLSAQEVKENFPDAYAAKEVNSIMAEDNNATVNVVAPGSSVNQWLTYRESDWYYNGNRYNIQKLVATPINISSSLWLDGVISVNYGIQLKAGVTNFISSVASTLLNDAPIYSTAISVYQAFESTWSGLQPVSEISKPVVLYSYNCRSTAAFAYVRLEGQSDSVQKLTHISTKCWTNVLYALKGGTWRQNSYGNWELCPTQPHGSYDIYTNPYSYNNTAEAVYAFTQNVTTNKSVIGIQISGPESKTIISIYPICPQFPMHCE